MAKFKLIELIDLALDGSRTNPHKHMPSRQKQAVLNAVLTTVKTG